MGLEGKSPSHHETRAVVKSGWKNVEETFQHVRLFSYGILNSSEVFLNVCSNEDFFSWPSDQLMICWSISEVPFAWWNCGYRFIFLWTNRLVKNRCVFFCCCGNRSTASFTTLFRPSVLDFFLIKLWTAMREHSKLGCSFQILYAFRPFSLKSFSVTAFCLSVKTILLRLSKLGNCETSERRPVTSTDFGLHCNGFLHCRDFFTRQKRKKTN